jgi:hydroxymethylpyrimidine pyrophosphatase-like HAD family hydrolase
MVALDLDGTVLDHEAGLSDRVRETVLAVRDRGVHVVVATGRGTYSTMTVLRRMGLADGWAVCSNGAVSVWLDPTRDTGYRIERTHTFDATAVVEALRAELPQLVFAVEEAGVGYRLSRCFPEGELDGPQRVVPVEDLTSVASCRVIARSQDHTAEEFLDLAARLGMHGVNYAVGWTGWLDIAPAGVTKVSGLEFIRRSLGVPRQAVVALGDGRNDIEMFGWAGWSVAMGQAVREVRDAADEVGPTVDQDGAAVILEKLCLC